jgi:hypothetical protein
MLAEMAFIAKGVERTPINSSSLVDNSVLVLPVDDRVVDAWVP